MRRLIYEVPRWHCFLHREARGLEQAEPTDRARRQFEDELFDRLFAGSAEPLAEGDRDPNWSRWATELHTECEQLPAFSRLAQEVCGDSMASAAAVEVLMEALSPEEPENIFQTSGKSLVQGGLRRQLLRGCDKASAVVEELREVVHGLGGIAWGPGSGRGAPQDGAPSRQLAQRLRNDTRLRRIALLAGRFKRIAAAKRRSRVHHGADELTDIEQGGELSRLLPMELAKLMHPTLRLALLRDVTERQAMQYRLSGVEQLGRGPLVLALDKSGSMEGERDLWATAVALALLDTAREERRPFGLLCFNDGVVFEVVVKPNEGLPETALFVGCSGGTDIGGVLDNGLSLIANPPGRLKQADLVLVTDGGSDTSSAAELRERAVSLGVSVLGVAIGMPADSLAPWCNEVESVADLNGLGDEVASKLFGR